MFKCGRERSNDARPRLHRACLARGLREAAARALALPAKKSLEAESTNEGDVLRSGIPLSAGSAVYEHTKERLRSLYGSTER